MSFFRVPFANRPRSPSHGPQRLEDVLSETVGVSSDAFNTDFESLHEQAVRSQSAILSLQHQLEQLRGQLAGLAATGRDVAVTSGRPALLNQGGLVSFLRNGLRQRQRGLDQALHDIEDSLNAKAATFMDMEQFVAQRRELKAVLGELSRAVSRLKTSRQGADAMQAKRGEFQQATRCFHRAEFEARRLMQASVAVGDRIIEPELEALQVALAGFFGDVGDRARQLTPRDPGVVRQEIDRLARSALAEVKPRGRMSVPGDLPSPLPSPTQALGALLPIEASVASASSSASHDSDDGVPSAAESDILLGMVESSNMGAMLRSFKDSVRNPTPPSNRRQSSSSQGSEASRECSLISVDSSNQSIALAPPALLSTVSGIPSPSNLGAPPPPPPPFHPSEVDGIGRGPPPQFQPGSAASPPSVPAPRSAAPVGAAAPATNKPPSIPLPPATAAGRIVGVSVAAQDDTPAPPPPREAQDPQVALAPIAAPAVPNEDPGSLPPPLSDQVLAAARDLEHASPPPPPSSLQDTSAGSFNNRTFIRPDAETKSTSGAGSADASSAPSTLPRGPSVHELSAQIAPVLDSGVRRGSSSSSTPARPGASEGRVSFSRDLGHGSRGSRGGRGGRKGSFPTRQAPLPDAAGMTELKAKVSERQAGSAEASPSPSPDAGATPPASGRRAVPASLSSKAKKSTLEKVFQRRDRSASGEGDDVLGPMLRALTATGQGQTRRPAGAERPRHHKKHSPSFDISHQNIYEDEDLPLRESCFTNPTFDLEARSSNVGLMEPSPRSGASPSPMPKASPTAPARDRGAVVAEAPAPPPPSMEPPAAPIAALPPPPPPPVDSVGDLPTPAAPTTLVALAPIVPSPMAKAVEPLPRTSPTKESSTPKELPVRPVFPAKDPVEPSPPPTPHESSASLAVAPPPFAHHEEESTPRLAEPVVEDVGPPPATGVPSPPAPSAPATAGASAAGVSAAPSISVTPPPPPQPAVVPMVRRDPDLPLNQNKSFQEETPSSPSSATQERPMNIRVPSGASSVSALREEGVERYSIGGVIIEGPPVVGIVAAFHDYEASDSTELGFRAGDQLFVFKRDASGWSRGLNPRTGDQGWFSEAYCKPAEMPPALKYDG